jgi:glycosyltransferase involved in cell wall biosynthesis
VIFPSTWFAHWIAAGLPYNRPEVALHRRGHLWEAGVDTDYFRPLATVEKTQDFFIYFKSQKYPELHNMNNYLFKNYFRMRGSMLMYYYYDAAMLREHARKARFCIVLDNTESQGLAALEIMACGCPLFVVDATVHVGRDNLAIRGATSVTCWDDSCGMKTEWSRLETDFPKFLAALDTYRPREFVVKNYSFQASAARLRKLISAT